MEKQFQNSNQYEFDRKDSKESKRNLLVPSSSQISNDVSLVPSSTPLISNLRDFILSKHLKINFDHRIQKVMMLLMAENDPTEGLRGKITTRVITPVYLLG